MWQSLQRRRINELIVRGTSCPGRRIKQKSAKGLKKGKGNKNTTTLSFSLHQERRWKLNTIEIHHFKSIVFHKFLNADKLHTNDSMSNFKDLRMKSGGQVDDKNSFFVLDNLLLI